MRRLSALFALLLACSAVFAFEKDKKDDPKKEADEGFVSLFNGKDLEGWVGDVKGYKVEDGAIVCQGGFLFSEKEYADFTLRLEFKVPENGNNGVAIRSPLQGNPAFDGIEIQVLDDDGPEYKDKLAVYQYCGSVYGVIPAKRGHTKKAGEWNSEEITYKGTHITVTLNGEKIVDGDVAEASKDGTLDKASHPGLKRTSGHIGFCGHGNPVAFRNIRIKELKDGDKKDAK